MGAIGAMGGDVIGPIGGIGRPAAVGAGVVPPRPTPWSTSARPLGASPFCASCASMRDIKLRASPAVAAFGYLLACVSSRLPAWRRSALLPVRYSANAS